MATFSAACSSLQESERTRRYKSFNGIAAALRVKYVHTVQTMLHTVCDAQFYEPANPSRLLESSPIVHTYIQLYCTPYLSIGDIGRHTCIGLEFLPVRISL